VSNTVPENNIKNLSKELFEPQSVVSNTVPENNIKNLFKDTLLFESQSKALNSIQKEPLLFSNIL
jgi:hypothetical protein